ncbi:hypothetical protein [Okeania sp. KiyG1]|uniref:hypothetical protein n=1 Tax=Okeania sp. KiyG1 TaxID=2720165 RepID=UPI001924B717|nr:hypothetical protein [Okeania sp. KiyG1]GGA38575.1 hypothetical protein CYANOKiyG1_56730 [Okeania sp. KiyG1]
MCNPTGFDIKPEKLLEEIIGNYLHPKQEPDPDTETVDEPESKNDKKRSYIMSG